MSQLEKIKRHYLKLREKQSKKRPKFRRYNSCVYKRVKKNTWRKARGIDSKQRIKKKGYPKSPNVGYRSPKLVRGLHPSGFKEIIVHNAKELEKIDPKTQVVKIGKKVGILKRTMIMNEADKLDIVILNPGKALIQEEEMVDLSALEEES